MQFNPHKLGIATAFGYTIQRFLGIGILMHANFRVQTPSLLIVTVALLQGYVLGYVIGIVYNKIK